MDLYVWKCVGLMKLGIYIKENKWRKGTWADLNKQKKKVKNIQNEKLGEKNGTNNTKERLYVLRQVSQFNHNEKLWLWQPILVKNRNQLEKLELQVLFIISYKLTMSVSHNQHLCPEMCSIGGSILFQLS